VDPEKGRNRYKRQHHPSEREKHSPFKEKDLGARKIQVCT
jgi:hypothetical protein